MPYDREIRQETETGEMSRASGVMLMTEIDDVEGLIKKYSSNGGGA